MQVETGFPTSVHWSVRSRINHLQRGGGEKKIFQYFIDSIGEEILYLQAFQGHSRENPVDPSLQDNVLIPNDFVKYVCHVGCHINMHSIIASGLMAGARKCQQGMTNGILYSRGSYGNASSRAERIRSDEAPTCCSQATMEGHQDAVHWIDIRLAQRIGTEVFPNEVKCNHSP